MCICLATCHNLLFSRVFCRSRAQTVRICRQTPILEQLCGLGFRLDHVNVHTHVAEGYAGSSLHGGGASPGNGNGFFFVRDQNFRRDTRAAGSFRPSRALATWHTVNPYV